MPLLTGRKALQASALLAASLIALASLNGFLSARATRRNPPKGRFIQLDGIDVHYVVMGAGPPLVILHGNGSMVADFLASDLVTTLAATHQLFLFDRPGYGHTGAGLMWWTAGRQARLLDAALDRLGISGEILLAHSWGTLVALALARLRPSRGCVLLGGYYFPTFRLDVWGGALPASPGLGDLWRWTIGPWLGRLFSGPALKKVFSPFPVPPRFKALFPVEMTLRPKSLKASAMEAILMIPSASQLSKHYSEILAPTVAVAGDQDQLISPSQSQRLANVMPHASFVKVSGAGHMIHHSNPSEVLLALKTVENQTADRPASPLASDPKRGRAQS